MSAILALAGRLSGSRAEEHGRASARAPGPSKGPRLRWRTGVTGECAARAAPAAAAPFGD
jgi:hypothetical protein